MVPPEATTAPRGVPLLGLLLLPVGALLGTACKEAPAEPVLTAETALGAVTADGADHDAPGVYLAPNLDDDDADGAADFAQALVDDDDRVDLTILAPHGATLTLAETDEALRVWQDGEIVLSAAGDSLSIDAGEDTVTVSVEAGDYRASGRLELTDDETGDTISLPVRAAPLILNHHLQASEQVMSVRFRGTGYDNTAMIEGYEAVLGDAFLRVSGMKYQDPWIQDEIEFATATGPDSELDVVIDSIRDGQWGPGYGLDPFAEDTYLGPGWSVGVWGSGLGNSQDYFGNLEISPPTTVDGVEYPFGRIYYGESGMTKPHRQVRNFLDEQAVQAPFVLDVSWLCVGHVDEFVTTVPAPGSRLGWKLLYTDVDLAWEIIDAMDPDTVLTRFAASSQKHWDTVGDMQDDTALRALNEELRDDHLLPNLEIMKAELGLTDDDIIYIPGLFEEISYCGGTTAAAFPGMANLVVADAPDGTPTLFVPDPFMRTDEADVDSDPIAGALVDAVSEELDVVFLDDWQVYHLQLGEVHCGSNVVRTPDESSTWWEHASHLLTEAE